MEKEKEKSYYIAQPLFWGIEENFGSRPQAPGEVTLRDKKPFVDGKFYSNDYYEQFLRDSK